MKKRPPQEDTWTIQEVGTPFPQNAVKAIGQPNMYVALGYKHGRPFMGTAWNESGVVQCSFIMNNSLLQGTEIGGSIQLLTYSQSHAEVGFWYDWIKYSKWKEDEGKDIFAVRCGTSISVFLPQRVSLGYLDLNERKAYIPTGVRKFETFDEGSPLMSHLLVLVRVTKGGPPHCQCIICSLNRPANRPPLMVNDWADYKDGDRFPTDKPVCRALGRPLNAPGGRQDQYVALWYRHGKPVMGRAWSNNGILCAAFVDSGREFTGSAVGSLQLLIELPSAAAGFDYTWLPYEQASKHGMNDFSPVHMDQVAPCVLLVNNAEVLGGINLKMEVAECSTKDGHVHKFEGGQLKNFMILCRKDRDDTMTI